MTSRPFTRTVVLLCCCLFFAGQAMAEKSDKLLDEIFQLSGIDSTLQQIPVLINATFDNMAGQGTDQKVIDDMKTIMARVMSPEILRGSAMDHMKTELSKAEISQIHKQLKSPFARRMSALEKEASQPDSMANIMAFAQTLESNPPSDQRINLIAELVKASNAVESSLTVRTEFVRGFLEATSQLSPPDQRMTDEQIDEKIGMMRDQMMESVAQEIILTYFYLYRSLSDTEVESYIAMYHAPEMAHFNEEMNIAMAAAFRTAGNSMMQELAAAYGG